MLETETITIFRPSVVQKWGPPPREYSWATGLYNFRARWYDPETGRWLSNDPIGISGGLNQYVFCGNSSISYIDPYGCEEEEKVRIIHETFLWNQTSPRWRLWYQCCHQAIALTEHLIAKKYKYWDFMVIGGAICGKAGSWWTYYKHHVVMALPKNLRSKSRPFILDAYKGPGLINPNREGSVTIQSVEEFNWAYPVDTMEPQ